MNDVLFVFFICHLQLLTEPRFRAIDKIKTIGSIYMGAVGLTPSLMIEVRNARLNEDGGFKSVTITLTKSKFEFSNL